MLIALVLSSLSTPASQHSQIAVIRKINNFQPSRIKLLPITTRDAPFIYQICSDPTTAKYYALNGTPWTTSRVQSHVKRAANKINERKIVTEFGDFIGIIGYNVECIGQNKFIHIIIAPAYHNCGVATHAYVKMIKLYFENNSDDYLFARVHKDNTASIKLHKKMGFEDCGDKKNIDGNVNENNSSGVLTHPTDNTTPTYNDTDYIIFKLSRKSAPK